MGASFSRSSGYVSHHLHRAGFRRVDHSNNASSATCGMCQLTVDIGTVARQCKEPGCPFLLHETCYQRPRKLKLRFAHTNHRLTLCAALEDKAAAANLPCSICAQPIAAAAYCCNRRSCAVFRVHPRCCDLPLDIVDIARGHEHQRLVLRPPAASPAGGTASARRCLRCQKTAAAGPTAPWSYQCLSCHREVCLKCLMRNSDADDTVRCCCNPGAVHCLGQVTGVFLCGLASGMGCPASTAPTTWPAN